MQIEPTIPVPEEKYPTNTFLENSCIYCLLTVDFKIGRFWSKQQLNDHIMQLLSLNLGNVFQYIFAYILIIAKGYDTRRKPSIGAWHEQGIVLSFGTSRLLYSGWITYWYVSYFFERPPLVTEYKWNDVFFCSMGDVICMFELVPNTKYG